MGRLPAVPAGIMINGLVGLRRRAPGSVHGTVWTGLSEEGRMAWSSGTLLGSTAALSLLVTAGAPHAARQGSAPHLAAVETHDNTSAAGTLKDGVLSIALVAAEGEWFPEGRSGPGHAVHVFGEEGRALRNPGPLVRVPAGTEVRAVVRNAIAGRTLTVQGLHDRPGSSIPVSIAPGDTTVVRFRLSSPGTYYYWASTNAAANLVGRFGKDGQLAGAIVVDPPGIVPNDRVYVIGVAEDSAEIPPQRHVRAAVVNGRSWPHSAIDTVTVGDSIRMRWINPTSRFHPIHLHGFFFRVDSKGDIAEDSIYTPAGRRQAVTELMPSGSTMSVSWVPEREGNWLLHCHMTEHISPALRGSAPDAHDGAHPPNHAMQVMAGLVIGWRVQPRHPPTADAAAAPGSAGPRKIRLLVQSAPRRYGDAPALGFVMQSGATAPAPDSVVVPGPPLILTRGEPVEITVVNRLDEATSIHWHGIELDSYFDGVSGWSGIGSRTAPPVAARDSFVVRFTPPRAGTFIYHSHFDEERQLASGLYGALIVVEPGTRHDPALDLPWVIGQRMPARANLVMLNGSQNPVVNMVRGRTYRLRVINIAANIPLTFSMLEDSVPARWRIVAKDGADLPPQQREERPAQLRIGVGETYDFEFTPARSGTLRLVARGPFGPIRMTGEVRVSEPLGP